MVARGETSGSDVLRVRALEVRAEEFFARLQRAYLFIDRSRRFTSGYLRLAAAAGGR